MPRPRTGEKPGLNVTSLHRPTPEQSAQYSHDMLISLKKLAAAHRQDRLAALLDAAAGEAQALAGKAHAAAASE